MTATIRLTTAEHIRRPEFQVRLQVDRRNQRLKVLAYRYAEVAPLADCLVETARVHGLGKIVLCARDSDWDAFLSRGFALEGRLDRFYNGAPGCYMAYFLDGDRLCSGRHEQHQEILEGVLGQPIAPAGDLPAGYALVTADAAMADELATVYDQVFASYPSPLTDGAYVRELMASGEGLFLAVTSEGRIVSAAAAEIERADGNAELTNCATLPDYRGEGLMAVLIEALERANHGATCLYSMARACSFGMNLVLHRAGYTFRGRLISHASIDGRFEDLNLWEHPGGAPASGSE
ncbi:MAG TPA: putative beta-lysine N-acetyltransferase [Symbiobacteriaceae bacterium]